MEWYKVIIETTSQGTEIVFGCLLSFGITGAQIIDSVEMGRFLSGNALSWDYVDDSLLCPPDDKAFVEFYIPADFHGEGLVSRIKEYLSFLPETSELPLGSLSTVHEKVDDVNWLNEWKKYYKPFRIGRHIQVVPFWEDYTHASDDIVFLIDPGSVFGTGQHQTTQLCVEALEDYIKPGYSLLDIGCGSGILFIVGLLLGAVYAFACDFDPAAEISSRENAERNKIASGCFDVITGDIFNNQNILNKIKKHSFDIILANIVADAIISLSAIAGEYLKPGGVFIASGIITERLEEVKHALVLNHWKIIKIIEKEGWHCIIGQNKNA